MAPTKTRVRSLSGAKAHSGSWGSSPMMPSPLISIKAEPMYISSNNMTTGGHLGGSIESQNTRLEERIARQHNTKHRLTGPSLAGEIFRTSWGDECREVEDDSDWDEKSYKDLQVEEFTYQPSLDLESPIETQERLERKIREYNTAYNAMCLAATRWHQLMEDVHDDPQVRKMFLDMQMIRKLSGLDHE